MPAWNLSSWLNDFEREKVVLSRPFQATAQLRRDILQSCRLTPPDRHWAQPKLDWFELHRTTWGRIEIGNFTSGRHISTAFGHDFALIRTSARAFQVWMGPADQNRVQVRCGKGSDGVGTGGVGLGDMLLALTQHCWSSDSFKGLFVCAVTSFQRSSSLSTFNNAWQTRRTGRDKACKAC